MKWSMSLTRPLKISEQILLLMKLSFEMTNFPSLQAQLSGEIESSKHTYYERLSHKLTDPNTNPKTDWWSVLDIFKNKNKNTMYSPYFTRKHVCL